MTSKAGLTFRVYLAAVPVPLRAELHPRLEAFAERIDSYFGPDPETPGAAGERADVVAAGENLAREAHGLARELVDPMTGEPFICYELVVAYLIGLVGGLTAGASLV